jgi:ELWxxDGT repeat protein
MPISGGSAFFLPGATPEAASILWATDGTDAGTRSLGTFVNPRPVSTLPGLAFFLASFPDGTRDSVRLWRTDGTEAGTYSLSPALLDSLPGSAVVGGRLLLNFCLFEAQECGLYATDGSPAGTVRVAGFGAGELTPALGSAFFFGGPSSLGLWRTDGTPKGPWEIRRLRNGWTRLLSASGSRLFYMTGDEGGELWTSDGTTLGTTLVRTFLESAHDFIPPNTTFLKATGNGTVTFVAARGQYFIADLWRSDGTPRGTVRLTRFQETSGVKNLRADQIAVLGQSTLFVSDDGVSGSRLWSSRGSLATTAPLVGCPGDCPELLAGTPLVPLGSRVLFAARDGEGFGLWTSDGTPAGTHLLADLCPGGCEAGPTGFTATAGKIWFRVTFGGSDHLARTDGTAAGTVVLAPIPASGSLDLATDGRRVFFAGMDTLDGAQPWVSDGTPAGTARASVLPAPAASSEPANLTALGGRLLFTAWDGTQSALWVADASGSGASIVPGTAVAGKAGPADVTVAGGTAFYVLDRGDGTAAELWRSDGTAAAVVADFPDRSLSDLHDFGGRLLFLATPTGDAERHIPAAWASDGTAAGTVQIFSLPDDTLAVVGLAPVGAEIYLEVDRESEVDVYRSDGTAAGTSPILRLGCCSGSRPPRFVRLGDTLYFTAFGELYRTDGTASGTTTVLAPDANGNPPIFDPSFPFTLGNAVFVFADRPDGDESSRPALFRIDAGQPALLASAGRANPFDFDPQVTPLGGAVFFRAADPDHGTELWRTDGTAQGTRLVADLVPGPGSSDPQGLTAAGGRLYFSAWDEFHGRELWTSDGTAAGTRLVDDVASGAFSSTPMLLTPVGGRLFFTADDGFTGREPWSVPMPASPSR